MNLSRLRSSRSQIIREDTRIAYLNAIPRCNLKKTLQISLRPCSDTKLS
jgi:hypothetical protein